MCMASRQADAAACAETRSGGAGGLARRSMKRASLMGARAGLTLSSVTQQLRRHSGDIHMLSHTLWAGACAYACSLPLHSPACLMVYSLTGRCSCASLIMKATFDAHKWELRRSAWHSRQRCAMLCLRRTMLCRLEEPFWAGGKGCQTPDVLGWG